MNNNYENEVLKKNAQKHNKSVAQVILRWLVEQDIVVLAKSVHPERMEENLAIFDFSLDDDDKKQIKALDQETSQFFNHKDPEIIKNMATRKLDYQKHRSKHREGIKMPFSMFFSSYLQM